MYSVAVNFPAYSIVFFASTLLSFIITAVVWHRRPAPGALPFALFGLCLFIYSLNWSIELGNPTIAGKIIWAKLEYVGILFAGAFWFAFALDFTGRKWWRSPRNLCFLSIIPFTTLIIVCTNELHGWFWSNIYTVNTAIGPGTIWEHGFWFWISAFYQYTLIITGIILLLRYGFNISGIHRKQVLALTAGALMPLLVNIIYLLNIKEIEGIDFTPLAMAVSGLIYTVTIFRYRFLDVIPVARGMLVENMPDGILVLNNTGAIIDANPVVEKLTGLKKSFTQGKLLSQVWSELNTLVATMDSKKHEEFITQTSVTLMYFDTSLTPLYNKRGKPTGKLIMLRDMTKRRQAEQTLRESESRYATLVEQSTEGVLIAQDGCFKFANKTAAKITGYSVEEIVGQPVTFNAADEDLQMLSERHRLRLEGMTVPDAYEAKIKHRDGRLLDIDISIGVITYNGKTANIVTIRDITERKITQRKLEKLYQEESRLRSSLQDEIEHRSIYTKALVHELRTPLTAILCSGDLLENEMKDDTLAAVVQNIRASSLNLKRRIHQLLELAQSETGLLKVDLETVDISPLVRRVISEMNSPALDKGIHLIADMPERPFLIRGDSNRLYHILNNLVGNAIRFTDKGQITVKGNTTEPGVLLMQVIDTGRGMEQRQLNNVFDPYREIATNGLGVGLALSKIYVELHRGKIWAESVPGSGTTFSFTLPLVNNAPV